MQIQLFKTIVNGTYHSPYMLYCPKTHACTGWDLDRTAHIGDREYAYNILVNRRYQYFIPNKEGVYVTTFELNSPDDFLNYPEFLV